MKTISQLRDYLIKNDFNNAIEKWHNSLYGGFTLENKHTVLHFTPCYQLKKAVQK